MRDAQFAQPNLPLYHEEAILRDRLFSNVNYDLVLNFHPLLREQAQHYLGQAKIKFSLNAVSRQELEKGLFLDFHGESISELSINGTLVPLTEIHFNKHRIHLGELASQLHAEAPNTVSIKFENSFVNNSSGLHRFQDPKDGEVYIYSHLEPFNCNRWFPCFDQPSIRAPIKLAVCAPRADWEVVANGKLESKTPLNQVSDQLLE